MKMDLTQTRLRKHNLHVIVYSRQLITFCPEMMAS